MQQVTSLENQKSTRWETKLMQENAPQKYKCSAYLAGYTILTGLVLTTARLEDHHAGKRATWLGFNWRGLSDGGAHMSHPPLQSPGEAAGA